MERRLRLSRVEHCGVDIVEFSYRDRRVPYVITPRMRLVDEAVPDEQPGNTSGSLYVPTRFQSGGSPENLVATSSVGSSVCAAPG